MSEKRKPMTVKEACEYLDVCAKSIYRRVTYGKEPKPGKIRASSKFRHLKLNRDDVESLA